MKKLLLYIFLSNKGAMDRILVALLLVIVGVVGVVAIETWFSEHKNNLKNSSSSNISTIISNS